MVTRPVDWSIYKDLDSLLEERLFMPLNIFYEIEPKLFFISPQILTEAKVQKGRASVLRLSVHKKEGRHVVKD